MNGWPKWAREAWDALPAPHLMATVWIAALAALMWLLLPGDWRGLLVIPALALWGVWALPGPRTPGAHELVYDDQAEELDDWPAELLDDRADDPEPPDADDDPVGHYAALAARYVRDTPWQQRGPDEGPRVIGPPTHDLEIVGRLPDPTVGPREFVELDHDDQAAEPGDPPAELDDEATIWPDPLDQWAEAAKEHVRATIDLARRMIL